jgi:hypothetical protein
VLWRDAYKQAVDIIRSSGYNGVLILDGSAYAQNPDCKLSYSVNRLIPLEIIKIIHEGIIKYGQYLVSVDPAKNLAFSVHMYAEWKKYGGNKNQIKFYLINIFETNFFSSKETSI